MDSDLFDLPALLHPLSAERYFDEYWQRQPLLLHTRPALRR
jgi:hypothetical protein